jgi:adenylate cyclase
VILGWAALLGAFLPRVATGLLIPGGLALAASYIASAHYLFARHNLWIPLAVPVLVQAPLATVGALLWGYLDTRKERDTIQEGIGHYLPEWVVENIIRERGELPMEVHGICLYTDAERYTALSEGMPPGKLREFLNHYYEALFEPVGRHGGFVSDVIGDAMLALWATADPDPLHRRQACRAAIEIIETVNGGVDGAGQRYLPTRIGLHCGELVLGNVGAIGRYEYRAVGDVVNTAQRIEDANKALGTRILASSAVLDGLDGLPVRTLGRFYLAGKSRAIELYEIVCQGPDANADFGRRCRYFHAGLSAFQQQDWTQAGEIFADLINGDGDDGPAHFYLGLCRRYTRTPPEPPWDAAVHL